MKTEDKGSIRSATKKKVDTGPVRGQGTFDRKE